MVATPNAVRMPASSYQPLSAVEKEIRILHVDPNLRDGLVSGRLTIVSLARPHPAYNAISWCWGDPSLRKAICVNGALLSVPAGAADVLRDVVVLGQRSSIPVWLDAVCINQDEIDERAQQVSIMKDVYTQSETVLAWVGHDHGAGKYVRLAMAAIVQQCKDHVKDLGDAEFPVLRDPRTIHRRGFSYDTLPESCNWAAVARFYSAELFHRLWIVQEISLAKHPICLFGEHSIPWTDVGLAAEWLMHRNYERSEYCGVYLQGIVNCSIISHFRARVSSLDGILTCSMQFKTSEPRDKVYGLLGLLQREMGEGEDPRDGNRIAVDYTLPIAHIYKTATRAIITMTGRLNILRFPELNTGFAETHGVVVDCASWVPQFYATSSIRTKGIRNFEAIGCDNDRKLEIDQTTSSDVLRVRGVVVFNITQILGILTDQVLNDFYLLSSLIHKINNAVEDDEHPEDVLYRTLTARNGNIENIGASEQAVLRESFNTLLHECRSTWPESRNAILPSTFDSTISMNIYIEALRITNRYKSYFLTDHGGIGLGCSEAAEGDQVCILFGNRMPFLLRPCESGGYRIVNNVFVHDLMDVSFKLHPGKEWWCLLMGGRDDISGASRDLASWSELYDGWRFFERFHL